MSAEIKTLHVTAAIPERITRLQELASNFWFSWHRPTRNLFNMLDRELWWKVGRNPKVFLKCVDQSILEVAAANETFLGAYRQVLSQYDSYLEKSAASYKTADLGDDDLIAYFCAEYGYHESFPVYSGGLGILAGDHCKSASDLRLPFIAVGLLYRRGYFRQRIDGHGRQIAEYPFVQADDTPVRPLLDEQGMPVRVYCDFPGRKVAVRIWRADVGRVPVLLLDTDLPENKPDDQHITRVLYGGNKELRIQQEIVLGIGGVKALRAVGCAPTVWHINEGHAAFQSLERAREFVAGGLSFDSALEAVAANTVFTTHTPVEAGHDSFSCDLLTHYLKGFETDLGIDEETFLQLGAAVHPDHDFNMTKLAIKSARAVNGVSRLHGSVSSRICADAWPEIPPQENPIGYVTNGVHVPTFIAMEWAELFDQQLGPAWQHSITDLSLLEQIHDIPDGAFWYASQRVKSIMLGALRDRLQRQFERNKVSESHGQRVLKYLDPDNPNVLTIGFARRFATYKRSTLLFQDLNWLREIVDHDERPVIFIFAGKAHPADEPGQQMLQEIHRIAGMPGFVGKVLLIEGYDMGLGRLLTSGVDIWLNTPIYPLEASGTSGMKAAVNGTVNLSVLDGWWAEAYNGKNGWAIPPAVNSEDEHERDANDARTLYEILQDSVVPLYYARDEKHDFSAGWVELCKNSMVSVLPYFNSHRTVQDYTSYFYGPAAKRGREMTADSCVRASSLAEWKKKVASAWPNVRIELNSGIPARMDLEDRLKVSVVVDAAGLTPADIRVECVLRRVTCSELTVPVPLYADDSRAEDGVRYLGEDAIYVTPLEADAEADNNGLWHYRLDFKSPWCGELGYEIRAIPVHADLAHPYETGLMRIL